ncbi:Thiosulfate sulfurtransferase GlpE [subsurface metagenome]
MVKMNLKNLTILVLSALLVTGLVVTGGCAVSETPAQVIENITPQEAFTLIQENENDPDFVIIDVRTPEEFADSHIENAVNIDYYSETFRDELNLLDKNKTYLIYCRSGNRSGSALDIMEELNFRAVYHLSDGIIGWNEEGLPTVK